MNISNMRTPYRRLSEKFLESDLISLDPMKQFDGWFKEACNVKEITEPNVMCLGTCTKDGFPSGRMVSLRGYHDGGFEFCSNSNSRKGVEMEENPQACLCLYWEPLKRSVRVNGSVKKLSENVANTYFEAMPREIQIGASFSCQSQIIPNVEFLESKEKEMKEIYGDDKEILKPDGWCVYLLVPDVIEFWQGQSTRIHDRLQFRRPKEGEELDDDITHLAANGWVYERLAP